MGGVRGWVVGGVGGGGGGREGEGKHYLVKHKSREEDV